MGYKYRQGETPDHVDSSKSNPTMPNTGLGMASSDSTKKAAPVDTVKLKGRMDRDKASGNFDEQKGSDMLKSNEYNIMDKAKVLFDKADRSSSDYLARKDTLNQARKGKIPAKP